MRYCPPTLESLKPYFTGVSAMNKPIKAILVALPLLISSSAFAGWTCTTSGGDSRSFTSHGRTQSEAQTNAFNTCNGAGSTGRRSCERNMQCNEDFGRPGPGPRPFPGHDPRPFPGHDPRPFPGHDPRPFPGHGPRPFPGPGPSIGVRCVAENARGMRFQGFGRRQHEAERNALDECYRAPSRFCQIRRCR